MSRECYNKSLDFMILSLNSNGGDGYDSTCSERAVIVAETPLEACDGQPQIELAWLERARHILSDSGGSCLKDKNHNNHYPVTIIPNNTTLNELQLTLGKLGRHIHRIGGSLRAQMMDSCEGTETVLDVTQTYISYAPSKLVGCLKFTTQQESVEQPFRHGCKDFVVVFTDIVISEHAVILGDNPSVTGGGPPVEIAWKAQARRFLSVDEMEKNRAKPRNVKELRLAPGHREYLCRKSGASQADMQVASERALATQASRAESSGRNRAPGQLRVSTSKKEVAFLFGVFRNNKQGTLRCK
jgi:hypothetical protein